MYVESPGLASMAEPAPGLFWLLWQHWPHWTLSTIRKFAKVSQYPRNNKCLQPPFDNQSARKFTQAAHLKMEIPQMTN